MRLPSRRNISIAISLMAMALIFLADTATDYAIAAAGFYTAVILAVAHLLPARRLILLAAACISLTITSFALSRYGVYQIGLINSSIGIIAIVITTYLALKMEMAKAAAHQAQARLLRVSRASTLGELTASIAHEVNQPLAAIVTSGNACQRWLAQNPANVDKARQAVERMLEDAHRASQVIVRMRELTRGQSPFRHAFALNPAVEEILSLSGPELARHTIALHLDLADNLPPVHADRVQIQQVLGNLVLNAMDAMLSQSADQRDLSVRTHYADGRVWVQVRDTGTGLPVTDPQQIFEPFWTTKDEGIGLGLSISRTIIEANGGRILAENQPGGGACFRFDLPLCPDTRA